MGRKKIYTEEKIQEIRDRLEDYISSTDIPIISEFCYLNEIPRTKIYTLAGLSDLLEIARDKKEAQLERLALKNEISVTMAIFSLKQLGWKDKQETEHTGSVQVVRIPRK